MTTTDFTSFRIFEKQMYCLIASKPHFELYDNLILHAIKRQFLLQSLYLWLPLDMLVHMAPLLSKGLK